MRQMLGASLALSLLSGTQALAGDDIEVMTYNQYLGADFASIVFTPPGEFNDALVEILQQIAATDFPRRAQRQAEQIAGRLPDLVGLQEVWYLDCVDAGPQAAGKGCNDPSVAGAFVDHLEVTLDALGNLGADYEAVAGVNNFDLTTITITLPDGSVLEPPGLPFNINGRNAFLIAIDRDVILARNRTVIDPVPVEFPSTVCRVSGEGCNYQLFLPIEVEVPGGVLRVNFERGFVAVDATVRGRDYRFVNTHLEIREPAPGNPLSRVFQSAQAMQLITTLALTNPSLLPVIVVGDINSSPEDEPALGGIVPPYRQFVDTGYTDIWTLRPGAAPGFTCCQAKDLLNGRSTLDERIDMIFSSEAPTRAKQARVVGNRVSDKTPPPGPRLWPSDHGGVVARLRF